MDKQAIWKDTQAYQVLSNLIKTKTPPQNILLTGNDVEVKQDLTSFYLQSLFCTDTSQVPCQKCQACQMIENQQHPDVYWYKIGAKFGKDEMSKLQALMSESALMDGNRAYVIQQLDILTPQAQNAWLKFLEEPYPNVYCIGWVENENQILPTVKSRFVTLFVQNQKGQQQEVVFASLVAEFLSRYQQGVKCADLLLLLEKNMNMTDDMGVFLESLLHAVVEQHADASMIQLISTAQKMIDANVPQDQVGLYFCLNIYREEGMNE